MKRFIAGFVLGALLFGAIGAYAATKETLEINRNVRKLVINGNSYEMGDKMFTSGGTTYVPLRFLSETFGHVVEWDNQAKTAQVHLDPCLTMEGIALKPQGGPGNQGFRAICLKERPVLLPKDVQVSIKITDHGESQDQLPALILKRGDRTAIIGRKGTLLSSREELGEEFAFLQEYVSTRE